MKRLIATTAFLALFSAGAVYAAAPEAMNEAVKKCCEAMEKCCCCDKDKADGKGASHEGHSNQ